MAGRSFATIAKEFRALPRADRSIDDLLREAMRVTLGVVTADGWDVTTLDPATLLATRVARDTTLTHDARRRAFEIEYGTEDIAKFSTLSRELTPVALLSEATQREPVKSTRYREVLAPAGYEYELRVALRSGKHTWGALALLRRASSGDFGSADEGFVRELADAFADAIRATLRAAHAGSDLQTGRVILLLDEKQQILAATPDASEWLAELVGDGPRDPVLPHTVRTTVNGARRGAERGGQTSAHVRVRGTSGRWLTVHAAVLGDGKSVVTIDDGRPIAIAPPVLEPYALTPEEAAVLRDLLHGYEDADIAARLGLSLDTVDRAVAAVLDKVGVASRLELPRKLFFEHYFARLEAHVALGRDGWFAGV
jgi:DNA-binding CsgD family transcriptional regulator/GAF domain-containing protein